MLRIFQNEMGGITIDSSRQRAFADSPDAAELKSMLFVEDVSPHQIIFDGGSQPSEVITFVQDWLSTRGYEVEIDLGLQRLAEQYKDEKSLVNKIKGSKTSHPKVPSVGKFGVSRKLLKHQQNALNHALKVRHAANFSVPGSGKTSVALAYYARLRKQGLIEKIFVVGPASSFVPWVTEFTETLGRVPKTVRLIGSRHVREIVLRHLEEIELVLCTYQMAYREKENIARSLRNARYLFVLDESHHIKNIDLGPWAKTVLDLAPSAERRMILSGTPAPYSVLDLWTQFTFLWPSQSLLGNRTDFEQRVNSSGDVVTQLSQDISRFYWRTKKSDLHLPKPIVQYDTIKRELIPKRQRLIIRLLEMKTMQEVKDQRLSGDDEALIRRWRKSRILRLLQAASNPNLLTHQLDALGPDGKPLSRDPTLVKLLKSYALAETPAKVSYVVGKVREIVGSGLKVVVWATFIENLQLLQRLLKDFSPLMVYGAVPAYDEDSDPDFENRERNIEKFKSNKNRNVLLANPAACAESISLHKFCTHAIYLERTFNCGQFLQSLDRIHRVGMAKGSRPHYFIPILECAVELTVDRRLRDRQRTLYELLNDDMPVLGYDPQESFLFESENDLGSILQEIVKEISSSENNRSGKRSPRN